MKKNWFFTKINIWLDPLGEEEEYELKEAIFVLVRHTLYFAVNLCRRQATAAVSTDTHSIIGFAAAVHNIFTEIGYWRGGQSAEHCPYIGHCWQFDGGYDGAECPAWADAGADYSPF